MVDYLKNNRCELKQIIVRKKDISVLEEGKLVETYKTDNMSEELEGNIYCGIVRNILPSMQSAFVDIGEGKNAFIYIKDIMPILNNETGNKDETFNEYSIKDLLKKNTPILVQVKKNRENQKGARVSKHIILTGRYVVLMPDADFITSSQKITDDKQSEKLKNTVKEILKKEAPNEKYAAIVRTVTENASNEDIEKDIKKLIKMWKNICKTYEEALENNNPQKIYDNSNIIIKILLGVIDNSNIEIFVENEELYNVVQNVTSEICKIDEKIKILVEKNNINNLFDLQSQIDKMNERKIWLKCGGFITIDKTEALTAIDVNSGKYVGGKTYKKADTIYKVNKEATIEIAKQIRLRNINGIIIVDYIDMENDAERNKIMELMQKETKKDRSKVQIVDFTKLDLLEITRKRL